jgi:hypothetical protein
MDPEFCPGCGRRWALPPTSERIEEPHILREDGNTSAPGRVSLTYLNEVVHQCADGTYLPPGEQASPIED